MNTIQLTDREVARLEVSENIALQAEREYFSGKAMNIVAANDNRINSRLEASEAIAESIVPKQNFNDMIAANKKGLEALTEFVKTYNNTIPVAA